MKKNRRDFFKISGLAGLGLASTSFLKDLAQQTRRQAFNMCGYPAPKLDTVRIGFIGVGARGIGAVVRMSMIEGVEIKAICDKLPKVVNKTMEAIKGKGHHPDTYTDSEEIWKKVCERDDIDLIYTATPWDLHTPIAVHAMEHAKHVAVEVPAAVTIDECWQLVETSERTRKHCMMLENCCYDFYELMTLNMARQGFFGEIVHCEGAYIHDLNEEIIWSKNRFVDMWQLKEIGQRKGNLYPTHGLGPVCQVMDINRGDRMDYMVSLSSNDFSLGPKAELLASSDDFYKPYTGKQYNGNMNTSLIKTEKGRTIMLQYDISSPRVYTRIQLISGTLASSLKYPLPGRISKGHEWLSEEEFKSLEERYTPAIVKKIGELAKQVGGHGGMDFLMDWRLIDCLRNGLPTDQDVYDAALWSSVGLLSELSVANRSASTDIPDFTCGSYKTNAPVDISLSGGGNTGIRNPENDKSDIQLKI